MAIRQYIGARYVPKFDGKHTTNKAYEPLTIVTDEGETTSYTSKKFVPVGVELTDNEYWAITGTLSGALLDLQRRVGVLENDISILTNRKYLFVGDSFAGGDYDENGKYIGDPEYNPALRVHSWIEKVIDYMSIPGDRYISVHHGGCGFVGVTGTFESLLNDVQTDNDITDIVIAGGSNDHLATESSIISAINSFVTVCKTKFPNANIYIAMVGFQNSAYMPDMTIELSAKVLPAYKKACAVNNLTFMSGCEFSILNIFSEAVNTTNKDHPNNKGCENIARNIVQCLNGAISEYVSPIVAITSNGDISAIGNYSLSSSTSYINEQFNNGGIDVNGVIRGSTTQAITLDGGFIDIVKLSNGIIQGTKTDYAPLLNGYVDVYNTATGNFTAPALIRFVGNKMQVASMAFDGSGYRSGTFTKYNIRFSGHISKLYC